MELDGLSVSSLLKTIGIENSVRLVLDLEHFHKAIEEAVDGEFNVFHLSCHGSDDGIALTDNTQPSWDEFVGAFQNVKRAPPVLVMSSCCGAASGLSDAFKNQKNRPKIIIGSTDSLEYSEYAVAWSILYHRFQTGGLKRSVAKIALQQITAVSHKSFVYRRWDDEGEKYLNYPGKNRTFEVQEVES